MDLSLFAVLYKGHADVGLCVHMSSHACVCVLTVFPCDEGEAWWVSSTQGVGSPFLCTVPSPTGRQEVRRVGVIDALPSSPSPPHFPSSQYTHPSSSSQLFDLQTPFTFPVICTFVISFLRLSYGWTSTQREGVCRPISSLGTLLASRPDVPDDCNLVLRQRSSKGCDWSANVNHDAEPKRPAITTPLV